MFFEGNSCIVGLQWGDEGKGKIVDVLAESASVIVRYCGGANAGHSVKIGTEKYATHLLPVGVFRPGVMNLIANGVVLDPKILFEEIDGLVARGIPVSPANLRVSYKAHVVMPWHKSEDAARESAAEDGGLGTTRRGIGPAYADKMHRTSAVRVADLLHPGSLAEKIVRIGRERNKLLGSMYDVPPLDVPEIAAAYTALGARLGPYVDDTSRLLIDAWKAGGRILFEGAHANLLDVDHGTYPYVTSSNCSALGLFTGAGCPPQAVGNFIGIMKAYSTRVGVGPFPTEQDNATGDAIRQRGNEYGTTTRRPRRCGWFDAPAVRYSVELNGITHIALMLLDVLSGVDELQICTGYTVNGTKLPYYRADLETLSQVTPIYETVPGWSEDISRAKSFGDLPKQAQAYVARLEELVGAPIKLVSVGPERSATLTRS